MNIVFVVTEVPNEVIPSVRVRVSSTALVVDWPFFSSEVSALVTIMSKGFCLFCKAK